MTTIAVRDHLKRFASSTTAVLLASLFAWVVDLLIPSGFATGVLYLLPVLLIVRKEKDTAVVHTAVFLSVLLVASAFFKPHMIPLSAVIFNRFALLVLVWMIIWNVLRKKKVVDELRDREREIRLLCNNFPDVVFRCDRELRILFANHSVTKAFGFPPEFFIGKSVNEIISREESLKKTVSYVDKVFETGQRIDIEVYFGSGENKRYFTVSLVPDNDDNGTVSSVIAFCHETTWSKDISARVASEHEKLCLVLDNVPSGVILFQDNGSVSFASPSTERILGRRITSLDDLKHAPSLLRTRAGEPLKFEETPVMQTLRAAKAFSNVPLSVAMANGEFHPVLLTTVPVRDESGFSGALIIIREIIDQCMPDAPARPA